ncbi:hypothetical protein [Microbispora rosea]|uniref:AbiTii domain-containing protein n=1 Tax=Microbispora rosea TaxID=58117 RepID=UPI0004C4151B|nr:hypothetical protein [Microbispora rosea]
MDSSLVGRIQRDVLDPSVSTADLLRACIALGTHARFEKIRDWASKELRGYDEDDEVPPYRMLHFPMFMDWAKGPRQGTRQVSLEELPENMRESLRNGVAMRDPIAQLAEQAKSERTSDLHITFGNAPILAEYMMRRSGDSFLYINAIYWKMSSGALAGIVDQVRTVLTEFITELAATMPADQETPTAQQAETAWHVAVTGKRNTFVVQMPTATGGGSAVAAANGAILNSGSETPAEPQQSFPSRIWKSLSKPGSLLVGIATVLALLVAVATWAGARWPWGS